MQRNIKWPSNQRELTVLPEETNGPRYNTYLFSYGMFYVITLVLFKQLAVSGGLPVTLEEDTFAEKIINFTSEPNIIDGKFIIINNRTTH